MKRTYLILFFLMMSAIPAKADPERFRMIREEAMDGDAKAQNMLGVYYQLGLSTEQNEAEAAMWFRKAAEQGHGEAQFNLGDAYEHGRGVPLDLKEALAWYRKSCDNGCKCGCRSYRNLKKELEFDPLP